ncbi:phage integrase Arm DNA-binding domain-containing protein [Burkholderia cenocepacia]|uniref:phage integrase Arm DNA-binding domain-containing protein n=1 Tax=Burkholderia cenocepacia TaxID=95486 RepID=UPI002236F86C|nr:phage integrase Arm DNA-binding domain-containing protein [Burkholderia cenocepacia]MCW5141099.1 phage integrase Arm DNA-binding domain-containing protein [Burkholderia cenocepacia]
MAARPRIRQRANWPDNLHEPRPGYYTWRDPRDSKTHILGRMPLQQAIYEAQEANLVVAQSTKTKALAERIGGADDTMADLIAKMPTDGLKPNTLKAHKYYDACIVAAIGTVRCRDLTTKHCADLIDAQVEQGKTTWARAIRVRLIAICRRGVSKGLMSTNPAALTERPKVKVKRRRMTLPEFQAILARAPEVADWLPNAMLLALVSGQDRATVASWTRADVRDGYALSTRPKTGIKVLIPLELRLDALDLSLGDVVTRCRATGVVSRYLIHHVRQHGPAQRGARVKLDTITEAFKKARILAGVIGDDAPTFHEIRSLAKRLYEKQGNVDTKNLLGHTTDESADLYADNRGLEPLKVTIGPRSSERILNNG